MKLEIGKLYELRRKLDLWYGDGMPGDIIMVVRLAHIHVPALGLFIHQDRVCTYDWMSPFAKHPQLYLKKVGPP